MNDRLNYITSLLSTIPESPGCYQYYDAKGTVIYVGKAKNLRKRISSYFQKEHENRKTRVLVKQIYDLRYIVVDSEADALLLENNLIKQYRPRYNVLLKDDKTYPSIVIKNESFPRIFQTRNIIRDGSLYYGPYSSVHFIRTLLHLIKELYPIRNCKHALTPEAIGSGKYKVCLQYHIKRCKAPCVGMQLAEEYNRNIADIKEILKGNSSKVSELLLERMKVLAEEMRFEEAQEVKRQYDLVESFRLKSTVVPMLHNVDVFSLDENETSFFINYMHVGSGAIVQVYTIEYQKKLDDEQKEYVLGLGIVEMRERFRSHANEIIVPFIPEGVFPEGISFTVPQRGDKRKLLELSLQNAKQYKVDKLKRSEKFNPEQRATRLLTTIQKDLHLPVLPMQIECFDNSNIQGTNPVAACVVFKKAKPSKKDYRHFHIKTVVGPDDFASMREIVTRRYTRLLEEKAQLPQLIIIDGGKGQLNAATEVLRELNLLGKITIVGLAKRLEEIFYPGDPFPLVLDKTSETLKVIQHLRDEAHRFGITFHRHMRSKGQIVSELDAIKGIGEKTKEALLKKYKSVKRIREAQSAELEELIGKKKATLVAEGLGMEVR
jgi:excinuclease ABC, C subunit